MTLYLEQKLKVCVDALKAIIAGCDDNNSPWDIDEAYAWNRIARDVAHEALEMIGEIPTLPDGREGVSVAKVGK